MLTGLVNGQKMTDRDLESLKGKPKMVQHWSSEVGADGKLLKVPVVMADETYDGDGAIIEKTFFLAGDREKFFTLEGSRVSKSERFEDPRVKMVVMGMLEMSGSKKTKDSRYDNKYVYRYDTHNRIVEVQQYSNDGSPWQKKKYEYDQSGRLLKETGSIEGRPSYSEVLRYGEDRNVAESTYTGHNSGRGRDVTRTVYSDYKLDVYGNWYERKAVVYNGKKVERTEIEGRIISYH